MQPVAVYVLAAWWVVWITPFIVKGKGQLGRKAAAVDPRSLWGMLFEVLGIAIAWIYFPAARGPVRIGIAFLLATLSTALGWWAVRHLGSHLRFQAGVYPDHELIRSGPYALVRHPMYSSLLLMVLATGLVMSTWPVMLLSCAVFLTGTEIRVRTEDRVLRERFGEEFEEYRRRVPAYLPPVR